MSIASDVGLWFRPRRMPSAQDPSPLTESRGAANELEIDWDEVTAFVRRRLRLELRGAAADVVDDLVQESMVRLLRVVRRERVENVEALMTEIARRTATDWLRRRIRWKVLIDPVLSPEDLPVAAPPGSDLGDPMERLRFVVVEFFGAGESSCRELAIAYFAEQDWKQVAANSGRSHMAVRKQWSRCLGLLREAAQREGGPLLEWME